MPRLDEVAWHLKLIWLLAVRPDIAPEGLRVGSHDLLRSFWAIVFAGPPILLMWSAFRFDYLATQPEGTATGPAFFMGLAALTVGGWLLPMIVLALITHVGGAADRVFAIVFAYNWLLVITTWTMSIFSFLIIVAPDDRPSFMLLYIIASMLLLVFEAAVFSTILSGRKLLVATLVLADFVISQLASAGLQMALGFL